jgi:hypothetical protein
MLPRQIWFSFFLALLQPRSVLAALADALHDIPQAQRSAIINHVKAMANCRQLNGRPFSLSPTQGGSGSKKQGLPPMCNVWLAVHIFSRVLGVLYHG